jgi:hypothetical protein
MDSKAQRTPKLIRRKPVSLAPIERPFVDALQTYGSGLPQDEEPLIKASSHWREIVQAVRDRGGKGELTIKLTCTGDAGKQVSVDCDVKGKMPLRKPVKRLLFADDNGDVVTMDPDQMQFDDLLTEAEPARAH